MHVAFFIDTFPTLSETFIRNQITGLIDLGYKVTIFCHPNKDPKAWEIEDVKEYKLKEYIKDKTIKIPLNKTIRILGALKIIRQNWTTNKRQIIEALNFFKHGKDSLNLLNLYNISPYFGPNIDVMQCHFGHIANSAVLLKKMKFPLRLQVMFHGFDIRHGIENGGKVYKDLIKYADRIQSISTYNTKHLLQFGFREDQIVFHPVGIDLSKFPLKTHFGTNSTINILSIGRLVWEKGYTHGVKAIATLINQNHLPIQYSIIGTGPLESELKALATNLGIEKQVTFLGAKDQQAINKQMELTDIFFLPSEAEALPVVLMEAQAKGLPVVATNVGSVTDMVFNGKNGFIAKPNNFQDMALKLKELIEKKEEWVEMGNFGRDLITNKYNIKSLNKRLIP